MPVALDHLKEEETERGDVDDADGEALSLIPLVYTVSGLFSASAVSYAVLPRQLVLAAQFGVTSVSQVPAGATAQSFRSWPALLPEDISLQSVQYPGRQDRLGEPCADVMQDAVRPMADEIEPILRCRTAFFGHIMGGSVAYEVCVELERRGRSPLSWSCPGATARRRRHVAASQSRERSTVRQQGVPRVACPPGKLRRSAGVVKLLYIFSGDVQKKLGSFSMARDAGRPRPLERGRNRRGDVPMARAKPRG